jgi:hypothetical protein
MESTVLFLILRIKYRRRQEESNIQELVSKTSSSVYKCAAEIEKQRDNLYLHNLII